MTIFISVGIVFLVMLIQSLMQLMPGIFSIFYHSALGKTTAKKADDMSLSFILGAEIFTALTFLAIYTCTAFISINYSFIKTIFPWIIVAVSLLEALLIFFFYYRKSPCTELFISRRFAKNLTHHASNIKNRSDAIMLGALSGILELPFTLPLYIFASTEAFKINPQYNWPIVILYIIVSIIPLFIIRAFYRSGMNLANIERFRVKNKSFFRLAIVVGYLMIALLAINLGITA